MQCAVCNNSVLPNNSRTYLPGKACGFVRCVQGGLLRYTNCMVKHCCSICGMLQEVSGITKRDTTSAKSLALRHSTSCTDKTCLQQVQVSHRQT